MSLTRRAILVSLVLVFSVGCDQATKVVARDRLVGEPMASYFGDTIRIVYAENTGAFLSLGASLPDWLRMAIFIVFVSAFLLGGLWWTLRTPELSRRMIFAASLLIGGGIGNLIDRVVFDGRVTDFLNLGVGSLRTGIFNIADVWIMVGVAIMLTAPE
ncbi:MAG: signal peptidase II, partial [Myxococcota bacterium]